MGNLTPWPHQSQCLRDVHAAVAEGHRRILVTSPTGGGKTWIMQQLALDALRQGQGCLFLSNRRLLIEQLSADALKNGISHGIWAANHEPQRRCKLQIGSLQTLHARRFRQADHPAAWVIVDEAHVQKGRMAQALFARYREQGAVIVGFTATPLDLEALYDTLITAGTPSDLRACGALVPVLHYGPDEPDLRKLQGLREGKDLTEKQQRQAIRRPGLWGRIWYWFEKLNPAHAPTILFAPGIPESIWFAEQFTAQGVTAVHIDGAHIWMNGRLYPTCPSLREDAICASQSGRACIACNRFVLREGIDMPWLAHGIFATVFGSTGSYLQAGGRLLRAYPALAAVVLQDHGGNWHRHGSLNADRDWTLDATNGNVTTHRLEDFREHRRPEPWRCPRCAKINTARHCLCGFRPEKGTVHSRPVVTVQGDLVKLEGDIYRPRTVCQKTEGPQLWKNIYFRCRTKQRTFAQGIALFALENGWEWPNTSWPYMPRNLEESKQRLVIDVPMEDLIR